MTLGNVVHGMPRCTHCETDHDVEALVRHRRGDLLLVHCPDCNCMMGSYRDPSRRARPS
jgi:hypothetical protein